MKLPEDNAILLSIINMRLRDGTQDLYDVCQDLDYDTDEVIARLADYGFHFDETTNSFK